MDLYCIIMWTLAPFGMLTLCLAVYCILTRPIQGMSPEYKGVLLSHSVIACISQMYLCGGTVPILLLPCAGGYPNGILTYIGMTTAVQTHTQVNLIALMGASIACLCVQKSLAILVHTSERLKRFYKNALYVHVVATNVIVPAFIISFIESDFPPGRQICYEMFLSHNYSPPEELNDPRAMFYSPNDKWLKVALINYMENVVVYFLSSFVAGTAVLKVLREHTSTTASARMIGAQRQLAISNIALTLVEGAGICVPALTLLVSLLMQTSNEVVVKTSFIFMGLAKIGGTLILLMGCTPYRHAVRGMLLKITPKAVHKTLCCYTEGTTQVIGPSFTSSTSGV